MEIYHCRCCDYVNGVLSNFKKHLVSKKHLKKSNGKIETNYDNYKRKVYSCDECSEKFYSRTLKSVHKKKYHFNNQFNQNNQINQSSPTIQNNLETLYLHSKNNYNDNNKMMLENMNNLILMDVVKSMQAQITGLINLSQTNASASEKTADVAKKSMNMLKYANTYLSDAPALKKLNKKEVYGMLGYDNPKNLEKENENFVRLVLGHYENKNIPNFFGNLIVNYYKEDDVKDVRFWSADVARLCFVVMHTIDKKGKKEWLNDKSGKKFISMVIDPMFDAIKVIFNNFLSFKEIWQKKCKNITRSQMDYLINSRQKCMEMLKDLKYNKYTQPILKIVAPNFNFDTYKKVVTKSNHFDNLDNFDNSNNSDNSDELIDSMSSVFYV